jgi:hypothetical protein
MWVSAGRSSSEPGSLGEEEAAAAVVLGSEEEEEVEVVKLELEELEGDKEEKIDVDGVEVVVAMIRKSEV